MPFSLFLFFFFFNDTATTEIYTLSLHDALPISDSRGHERTTGEAPCLIKSAIRNPPLRNRHVRNPHSAICLPARLCRSEEHTSDSSHLVISYAVFCLKKKKETVHSV